MLSPFFSLFSDFKFAGKASSSPSETTVQVEGISEKVESVVIANQFFERPLSEANERECKVETAPSQLTVLQQTGKEVCKGEQDSSAGFYKVAQFGEYVAHSLWSGTRKLAGNAAKKGLEGLFSTYSKYATMGETDKLIQQAKERIKKAIPCPHNDLFIQFCDFISQSTIKLVREKAFQGLDDLIRVNLAYAFANLAERIEQEGNKDPSFIQQSPLVSIVTIICRQFDKKVTQANLDKIEAPVTALKQQLLEVVQRQVFEKENWQERLRDFALNIHQEPGRTACLELLVNDGIISKSAMREAIDVVAKIVEQENLRDRELFNIFNTLADDILKLAFPDRLNSLILPGFQSKDLTFMTLKGPLLAFAEWYLNDGSTDFNLYKMFQSKLGQWLLESYHSIKKDPIKEQVWTDDIKKQVGNKDIKALLEAPELFLNQFIQLYIKSDESLGWIEQKLSWANAELSSGKFRSQKDRGRAQADAKKIALILQYSNEGVASWILDSLKASLKATDPSLIRAGAIIKDVLSTLTLGLLAKGCFFATPSDKGQVEENAFLSELLTVLTAKIKALGQSETQEQLDQLGKDLIQYLPFPPLLQGLIADEVTNQATKIHEELLLANQDLENINHLRQRAMMKISKYAFGKDLIGIVQELSDRVVAAVLNRNVELAETAGLGAKLEELVEDYLPGLKIDSELINWFKSNVSKLGNQLGASPESVAQFRQSVQAILLNSLSISIEKQIQKHEHRFIPQLLIKRIQDLSDRLVAVMIDKNVDLADTAILGTKLEELWREYFPGVKADPEFVNWFKRNISSELRAYPELIDQFGQNIREVLLDSLSIAIETQSQLNDSQMVPQPEMIQELSDRFVAAILEKRGKLSATENSEAELEILLQECLSGVKIDPELISGLKNYVVLLKNQLEGSLKSREQFKQNIHELLSNSSFISINMKMQATDHRFVPQLLQRIGEAYQIALEQFSPEDKQKLKEAIELQSQIRKNQEKKENLTREIPPIHEVNFGALKAEVEEILNLHRRQLKISNEASQLQLKYQRYANRFNIRQESDIILIRQVIQYYREITPDLTACTKGTSLTELDILKRTKANLEMESQNLSLEEKEQQQNIINLTQATIDLIEKYSPDELKEIGHFLHIETLLKSANQDQEYVLHQFEENYQKLKFKVFETKEGLEILAWMNAFMQKRVEINDLNQQNAILQEDLHEKLGAFRKLSGQLSSLIGLDEENQLLVCPSLHKYVWPLIKSVTDKQLAILLLEHVSPLLLPVLERDLLLEQMSPLLLPVLEKDLNQSQLSEKTGSDLLANLCKALSKEVVSQLPTFLAAYQSDPEEIIKKLKEATPDAKRLHELMTPHIRALMSEDPQSFEASCHALEQYIEGALIQFFCKAVEQNIAGENSKGIIEAVIQKLTNLEKKRDLIEELLNSLIQIKSLLEKNDLEGSKETIEAVIQKLANLERKTDLSEEFLNDLTKIKCAIEKASVGSREMVEAAIQKLTNLERKGNVIEEILGEVVGLKSKDDLAFLPPALRGVTYAKIQEILESQVSPIFKPLLTRKKQRIALNQISGSPFLGNLCEAAAKDLGNKLVKAVDSYANLVRILLENVSKENPTQEQIDQLAHLIAKKIDSSKSNLNPASLAQAIVKSLGEESTPEKIELLSRMITKKVNTSRASLKPLSLAKAALAILYVDKKYTSEQINLLAKVITEKIDASKTTKPITNRDLVKACKEVGIEFRQEIEEEDVACQVVKAITIDGYSLKNKILSISVTPEQMVAELGEMFPHIDEALQISLVKEIRALLLDESTSDSALEFIENYIEGLLLGAFNRIAKKNPPTPTKDVLIVTTEKLLKIVTEEQHIYRQSKDFDKFAKQLNKRILVEVLGIESPSSLDGLPPILQSWAYHKFKDHLGLYLMRLKHHLASLEEGAEEVKRARESLEAIVGETYANAVAQDLGRMVVDILPYILSQPTSKNVIKGSILIGEAVKDYLEDLKKAGLTVAQVLIDYPNINMAQNLLGTNLLDLANDKDGRFNAEERAKIAEMVGHLLLKPMNTALSNLMKQESEKKNEFNQNLAVTLFETLLEHVKHVKAAKKLAQERGGTGFSYEDFISIYSKQFATLVEGINQHLGNQLTDGEKSLLSDKIRQLIENNRKLKKEEKINDEDLRQLIIQVMTEIKGKKFVDQHRLALLGFKAFVDQIIGSLGNLEAEQEEQIRIYINDFIQTHLLNQKSSHAFVSQEFVIQIENILKRQLLPAQRKAILAVDFREFNLSDRIRKGTKVQDAHPALARRVPDYLPFAREIDQLLNNRLNETLIQAMAAELGQLVKKALKAEQPLTNDLIVKKLNKLLRQKGGAYLSEQEKAVLTQANLKDRILEEARAPDQNKQKQFFLPTSKKLLKFFYPEGRESLTFIVPELRNEAWKLVKTKIFPQVILPQIMNLFLDPDTLTKLALSGLEVLRDSLNGKVVLDSSPSQDCTEGRLTEISGELIYELIDISLLPKWAKDLITARDEHGNLVYGAALAETIRTQFNEDFLERNLKKIFQVVSEGHFLQFNPTSEAEKQAERVKMEEKLAHVARETVDATVSYGIRKKWAEGQKKLDEWIEKHLPRVGMKVKKALDAIFNFIFFKVIGAVLKVLCYPFTWLFKQGIYRYSKIDAHIKLYLDDFRKRTDDQSGLSDNHHAAHEDFVYKGIDALSNLHTKFA